MSGGKIFFPVSRVDICIYDLCRFYKVYSTFDILSPDQDLDNKWMSTSLIDPN